MAGEGEIAEGTTRQEQGKKFFNALKAKKTYLEFTDDHGAEYHRQVGAQLILSERMFNRLDERVKP